MEKPEIHDRGRGPEIKGTRITVYDVFEFQRHGVPVEQIAETYRLSPVQIQAAVDYIHLHEEAVADEYGKIMERINRGNSPEIEALLSAQRPRFLARAAELRDRAAAAHTNGNGKP